MSFQSAPEFSKVSVRPPTRRSRTAVRSVSAQRATTYGVPDGLVVDDLVVVEQADRIHPRRHGGPGRRRDADDLLVAERRIGVLLQRDERRASEALELSLGSHLDDGVAVHDRDARLRVVAAV